MVIIFNDSSEYTFKRRDDERCALSMKILKLFFYIEFFFR